MPEEDGREQARNRRLRAEPPEPEATRLLTDTLAFHKDPAQALRWSATKNLIKFVARVFLFTSFILREGKKLASSFTYQENEGL